MAGMEFTLENNLFPVFVKYGIDRFRKADILLQEKSAYITYSFIDSDNDFEFLYNEIEFDLVEIEEISHDFKKPNFFGPSNFENRIEVDEFRKMANEAESISYIKIHEIFKIICFDYSFKIILDQIIKHITEPATKWTNDLHELNIQIIKEFEPVIKNFIFHNKGEIDNIIYDLDQMLFYEVNFSELANGENPQLFLVETENLLIGKIKMLATIFFEEMKAAIKLPYMLFIVSTWIVVIEKVIQIQAGKFIDKYPEYAPKIDFSSLDSSLTSIFELFDDTDIINNLKMDFFFLLKDRNCFKNNFNYIDSRNEFLESYEIVLEKNKFNRFKKQVYNNNYQELQNNITIEEVDLMNGREFEEFIAKLFEKLGYKTEITKSSGDQGVDIIAIKNTQRLGIQAKCYSGSVGNSAIQEVVAGLKYYNLTKGLVITNNYFTPSALELAKINDIITWDRTILKEKVIEYSQNNS